MPSSDLRPSRRDFLRGIGSASLLVTARVRGGSWHEPADTPRKVRALNVPPVLVMLHLAGGFDVNDLVVRHDDLGELRRLRPDLMPAELAPATDGMWFNPIWAPLADRWNSGQCAIFPRVGFPDLGPSHHRAVDIWQTAPIDSLMVESTGWLGRAAAVLAERAPVTLGAVAQTQAAAVFAGPPSAAGLIKPERLVGEADGFDLRATLGEVAERVGTTGGVECYSIVSQGWDFHFDQRRTHDRMAPRVAASLRDFFTRLEARDVADRVLTILWSEFGRSRAQNQQGGTDDAVGAPVLILGNSLRSARRATKHAFVSQRTLDLRAVYAAVLTQWLRCGAAPGLVHAAPDPIIAQLLGHTA